MKEELKWHPPMQCGFTLADAGFDVEKATIVFDRAIEAGMMTKDGANYRWVQNQTNTKALFAYLIGRMFGDKVEVERGYKTDRKGKYLVKKKNRFIWVQSTSVPRVRIILYFGIDVSQQRWNAKYKRYTPRGAEKVEELLKGVYE